MLHFLSCLVSGREIAIAPQDIPSIREHMKQ